jgi:hypothetical protein
MYVGNVVNNNSKVRCIIIALYNIMACAVIIMNNGFCFGKGRHIAFFDI